jgi:hypothetical protein
VRDYEVPPREETDSYNRDRGQVSQADLIADWREVWGVEGDEESWEARQQRQWLARMRERAT